MSGNQKMHLSTGGVVFGRLACQLPVPRDFKRYPTEVIKSMTPKSILVAVFVVGLVSSTAQALGPYSIDRLYNESDIVIVCTVQRSSVVKNDSGYGPSIYDMFLTRVHPIVYTKGTASGSDVAVRHFGTQHNHGRGTGGKPARFFRFIGVAETEHETSLLAGTEHFYVLFLKRDGAEFVPTSGQRDARDSIVPLRLTRNQAWIQADAENGG